MVSSHWLLIDPFFDDRQLLPPTEQIRQGFVDRFLKWLLAPIDFPGKWPDDRLPTETYNEVSKPEPNSFER